MEEEEKELDVTVPAHFIDPQILTRLDEVVRRTGRPRSSFVEEAILEVIEDAEDVLVAEERIREIEEDRSYTIALEEIDREEDEMEAVYEALQG